MVAIVTVDRRRFVGEQPPSATASSRPPDPTLVAPRPGSPTESVSIDDVSWAQESSTPTVSAGEDLWVEPADQPTTQIDFDIGDDGQFRLWPEEEPEA